MSLSPFMQSIADRAVAAANEAVEAKAKADALNGGGLSEAQKAALADFRSRKDESLVLDPHPARAEIDETPAPLVISTVAAEAAAQEEPARPRDVGPAYEGLPTNLASRPVIVSRADLKGMPASISDQTTPERHSQTEHRISTWLCETKQFLTTIEHRAEGDHGKLIEMLRAIL